MSTTLYHTALFGSVFSDGGVPELEESSEFWGIVFKHAQASLRGAPSSALLDDMRTQLAPKHTGALRELFGCIAQFVRSHAALNDHLKLLNFKVTSERPEIKAKSFMGTVIRTVYVRNLKLRFEEQLDVVAQLKSDITAFLEDFDSKFLEDPDVAALKQMLPPLVPLQVPPSHTQPIDPHSGMPAAKAATKAAAGAVRSAPSLGFNTPGFTTEIANDLEAMQYLSHRNCDLALINTSLSRRGDELALADLSYSYASQGYLVAALQALYESFISDRLSIVREMKKDEQQQQQPSAGRPQTPGTAAAAPPSSAQPTQPMTPAAAAALRQRSRSWNRSLVGWLASLMSYYGRESARTSRFTNGGDDVFAGISPALDYPLSELTGFLLRTATNRDERVNSMLYIVESFFNGGHSGTPVAELHESLNAGELSGAGATSAAAVAAAAAAAAAGSAATVSAATASNAASTAAAAAAAAAASGSSYSVPSDIGDIAAAAAAAAAADGLSAAGTDRVGAGFRDLLRVEALLYDFKHINDEGHSLQFTHMISQFCTHFGLEQLASNYSELALGLCDLNGKDTRSAAIVDIAHLNITCELLLRKGMYHDHIIESLHTLAQFKTQGLWNDDAQATYTLLLGVALLRAHAPRVAKEVLSQLYDFVLPRSHLDGLKYAEFLLLLFSGEFYGAFSHAQRCAEQFMQAGAVRNELFFLAKAARALVLSQNPMFVAQAHLLTRNSLARASQQSNLGICFELVLLRARLFYNCGDYRACLCLGLCIQHLLEVAAPPSLRYEWILLMSAAAQRKQQQTSCGSTNANEEAVGDEDYDAPDVLEQPSTRDFALALYTEFDTNVAKAYNNNNYNSNNDSVSEVMDVHVPVRILTGGHSLKQDAKNLLAELIINEFSSQRNNSALDVLLDDVVEAYDVVSAGVPSLFTSRGGPSQRFTSTPIARNVDGGSPLGGHHINQKRIREQGSPSRTSDTKRRDVLGFYE